MTGRERVAHIAGRISIHTSPKGGDRRAIEPMAGLPISIHTSPKGGDQMVQRREAEKRISIHTSPKGGDAGGGHAPP